MKNSWWNNIYFFAGSHYVRKQSLRRVQRRFAVVRLDWWSSKSRVLEKAQGLFWFLCPFANGLMLSATVISHRILWISPRLLRQLWIASQILSTSRRKSKRPWAFYLGVKPSRLQSKCVVYYFILSYYWANNTHLFFAAPNKHASATRVWQKAASTRDCFRAVYHTGNLLFTYNLIKWKIGLLWEYLTFLIIIKAVTAPPSSGRTHGSRGTFVLCLRGKSIAYFFMF